MSQVISSVQTMRLTYRVFYGKHSSTVTIPTTDKTFRFPDWLWGPTSLLLSGHRELFSPEVKWLRPEADHSSLCGAKVRNEWSYTSTPTFCYVMHGDNLITDKFSNLVLTKRCVTNNLLTHDKES